MSNLFDELQRRGFVEQVSDEESLRRRFGTDRVTGYIGFDPTASSLHIGNLMQIMLLAHLQRAGHRPIALLGGGTAMVGDPSGKTEMRKLLTREQIVAHGQRIKQQLSRFLDFANNDALFVDNADWLLELNYVDFLRNIGRHFSVNRMLAAEAYKIRMETGLSFLEFNYQLLQAYDFLMLYRKYGCILQMGGNDQWGNILAGTELVRKVEGEEVYALTAPLLTTAGGQKMGKTASGAVWLDAELVSPYEFYQYWINVDDRDVVRLLNIFTFLPPSEVDRFREVQGAGLREAKELLAYEVTALVHGEEESQKARKASKALFDTASDSEDIPSIVLSESRLEHGIGVVDLFHVAGLASSKSAARRLIQQGGGYVNRRRVRSIEDRVTLADFSDGVMVLRAGKKRYQRVVLGGPDVGS